MSDVPRKPLIWEGEEARQKKLREMGLDEDMLPLDASPEEKQAEFSMKQWRAEEERRRKALEMNNENELKPLIGEKAVAIIAVVATLLSIAGGVAASMGLPAWVAFGLSALAGIAAFLAGKAIPPLRFTVGKPIVPAVAVPVLSSLAVALTALASQMSPGSWQAVVMFAGTICTGLAGISAPQDLVKK